MFDALLEARIPALKRPGAIAAFWDVDAPATLDRIAADPEDPFRELIPNYDIVFTYGGGPPVVAAYRTFGARICVPIYNGLDPATHHPAHPRSALCLRSRSGREPAARPRAAHRRIFPVGCRRTARARFRSRRRPAGATRRCRRTCAMSATSTRPITTRSTRRPSLSSTSAATAWPRTATARPPASSRPPGPAPASSPMPGKASRCSLNRDAKSWSAKSGPEVAEHLARLTLSEAQRIGAAARDRALAEHTYARRVALVEQVLRGQVLTGQAP